MRRRFNRVLFAVARLCFPTDVGSEPLAGAQLRRVLVMANYFVGDLVVATPALTYLRRAAPAAHIDVLVSPRSASLLDGDPRVDRVLVHDPRRDGWFALVRRLRRERYDLVADFVLPHHLREGLLTAFVAGRHAARVTSHRPVRFAGLFTHRGRVAGFERQYMAARLLHALRDAVRPAHGDAASADATPDAAIPSLVVHPEADARVRAQLGERAVDPFVAFNAWASDPVRTLTVAQGGAIAARIARAYPALHVVLSPPPGKADAADAMADVAREALTAEGRPDAARRVLVVAPSRHLADLVALIARAAVVVTPDTANVHLAAAFGRPLVALYTPLSGTKMVHWAPRNVPLRRVVTDGRVPLSTLSPVTVLDAFDALWDEVHPPTAATARRHAQAVRAPGAAVG